LELVKGKRDVWRGDPNNGRHKVELRSLGSLAGSGSRRGIGDSVRSKRSFRMGLKSLPLSVLFSLAHTTL
jgi:hypothetical protein